LHRRRDRTCCRSGTCDPSSSIAVGCCVRLTSFAENREEARLAAASKLLLWPHALCGFRRSAVSSCYTEPEPELETRARARAQPRTLPRTTTSEREPELEPRCEPEPEPRPQPERELERQPESAVALECTGLRSHRSCPRLHTYRPPFADQMKGSMSNVGHDR
jgi:hypothetical protein